MVCPECGSENVVERGVEDGSFYCKYCGMIFGDK